MPCVLASANYIYNIQIYIYVALYLRILVFLLVFMLFTLLSYSKLNLNAIIAATDYILYNI